MHRILWHPLTHWLLAALPLVLALGPCTIGGGNAGGGGRPKY